MVQPVASGQQSAGLRGSVVRGRLPAVSHWALGEVAQWPVGRTRGRGLERLSVVVVRVMVSDRVLACWFGWAWRVGGRPGAAAGQVLRERYGPFVTMNQPGAAHPAVGYGYRPVGLQRPCSRLEVCTGRAAAGCPWPGPLNARAPPVLRILVLLGIWLIITATHVSIQSAVQGGANPARRNKPQDARLRVSARARAGVSAGRCLHTLSAA